MSLAEYSDHTRAEMRRHAEKTRMTMTGMSPTLARAAAILEREAGAIKESLTVAGRSGWVLSDEADRQAKADHDEMLELAAKLRLMAGLESRPDPLSQALNEGDGVYRP